MTMPARCLRRTSHGGDDRLTAVVITRNRCAEALRALRRLAELPERPRTILVDNGSSDGTSAAVHEQFPQVELIAAAENMGAAARNLGVQRADRPYVAFCDDDTWWAPGSLALAADLLDAHPRLAVINARVLIEPGGHEDPTCREMAHSPLKAAPGMPGRPLLGFMAGAAVVRRAAFLAAGGFPEAIGLGGEEEWLAVALAARGWSLSYVPELLVHHQPSPRRNATRRGCQQLRNALWFAWLHRPWRRALIQTLVLARQGRSGNIVLRGFAAAIAGLPRVLPMRTRLPPEVEAGLCELERQRSGQKAMLSAGEVA